MLATFSHEETIIRPDDIINHPTLCKSLKVPERIIAALTENGVGMSREELAAELEMESSTARATLKKAIQRGMTKKALFETSDGKIGLIN